MFEELYQPYLKLTAEQRKLLCFLAYANKETDGAAMGVYRKLENLTSEQMKGVIKSLMPFLERSSYYFYDQYALGIFHRMPLLVYMLCECPIWLRLFNDRLKQLQAPGQDVIIDCLRLCIGGKELPDRHQFSLLSSEQLHAMAPLASYRVFLPMLRLIPSHRIPEFIQIALVYQAEYDLPDPDNTLLQLLSHSAPMLPLGMANELHSAVALYDFFKQGRIDPRMKDLASVYTELFNSLSALYAGNYDKAFSAMTLALREHNRNAFSIEKGFFSMVLSNYVLVMAFHFKTADQHKKLTALLNKEQFVKNQDYSVPVLLANYLVNGTLPTARDLKKFLCGRDNSSKPPLYHYLTLLVASFFGIPFELSAELPPLPRMRLLRHELSPWLPLSDEERQQLEHDFGGKPILGRIRYKQPWERVIEELTPQEATSSEKENQEQTVRVMYLVNNDRAEVREQSRLKSGLWGAGKRLSLESFCRGIDFMNDADRQIAAKIRNVYYFEIDVKLILPHLIGSDRVYTGRYAPFDHVTIEEEKPYLMIERSPKGFLVSSNLSGLNLSNSVLYRRDNDFHYTVFDLTPQQRNYYQKLLGLGTFPLEAEPLLRQFLPRVSNVVEVHSDLVEGGTTLEQRQGSPVLCLQVMPTMGTQNTFSLYCVARPLPDGVTLFIPAKGLNPCVAEADGTRYQVTRDMRGERENLQLLTTFLDDNNILSADSVADPFESRSPVILSAEELLMTMQFVQEQGQEHFVMEWPEGGQLHLKNANPSSWNIGLKSKNGWFEVEGDIPIDDDTVLTAAELLQLVGQSRQHGFVRLGEGQFLAITERLRKQLARLESLTTSHRGHLGISELHATLLGSALSGDVEIRHDKKLEKLQDKIEQSMKQRPDTPATLKAELRDYQQDGYQWLCRMTGWGAGVCLADDMGLGKTVQTIAFLLHTQDEGPSLVAAPASVVLNWRRELQRFAPSLNVIVLNAATDRQQAISEAQKGDVVLTTYGLFVNEAEHLQQKQWNTICLDEAHVIKNRETKTSQAVMQLQAHHRIILTGTPVQNHLGELWNLYQFINPGLLGSYDQFQEKYITPIEQHDDKERSRQLKRIIQPFILRRTKQEVVEELPDKTEMTMPVELSQDEMAVYEVIRRRAKQLLEADGSGSPSVNTLAEITRLRQAACAPQLAEKGWQGECSKISTLMSLLEEIVGAGNSVLVFSQFTSFLALIRQALDASATFGPDAYAYLDGSVPIKQRDQLVQDFQRGRQRIFLISLKAGGLGLNLTGANYVVHLDPWWNPAIEQQATDRAYRIGQRQNVTVYHLISQHTIEEKILRLHETKRNLADAMLSGTSQSHKLSAKDLMQMISE